MHRNAIRFLESAEALGLDLELHEFSDTTHTAADAAAAIGVPVGAIVKSLVFDVDGALVVALVSGSNQLDEGRLAAAAGGTAARRVDAETVRTATGFPVGGVPPFGHASDLPVFVDEDLLDQKVIWAAAGTPNVNFPIPPATLVEAGPGDGRPPPPALTAGPATARALPLPKHPGGRPTPALLDLLGRRWALRILWELSDSPLGFRTIQDRCDQMSSSVLRDRLADLTDAGIVGTDDAGRYGLTAHGAELVELLDPLSSWAERWARRMRRK